MRGRRFAVALAVIVGATVGAGPIAPAGAASGTYDDPGDDVMRSSDGTAADDPRLDVERITLRNEAGLVEVRVEVAEAVALTSADWKSQLLLVVLFMPPDGEGASGLFLAPTTSGGRAFTGPALCDATASADTAADAYVLRATGDCVRGMPRDIVPLVLFTSSDENGDFAPDDALLGDPPSVSAGVSPAVRRLAGTDRTLTAVELSKDRWDGGTADAVVLASATSFPDALAGGPLAWMANAPILLTGAGGLDARTRAEISRVLPAGGRVYLLGGTAVLSDQVAADVRAGGWQPERIAGTNRFETAVAIAKKTDAVSTTRFGDVRTDGFGDVTDAATTHSLVLIADGRSFTDGLIAGGAAPYAGAVVVLTDGASMPAATKAYLDADRTDHVAIGSNAAAAAPTAESITGSSPSQLSRLVAEELAQPNGIVAVATEAGFADALAGGAHVGSLGGPLLLTNGGALSPDVRTVIENSSSGLREVVVYGGTAAVSDAVVQEIRQALA